MKLSSGEDGAVSVLGRRGSCCLLILKAIWQEGEDVMEFGRNLASSSWLWSSSMTDLVKLHLVGS